MKMYKRGLLFFSVAFSLASFNAFAVSSSSNYQLGYAAFDGGGGIASSSSYDLNASAIGTSIHSFNSASTNFAATTGTQWIDDDGDGLDTGVEVVVFNSNPNNTDTDNDLLTDGEEVTTIGSNPILFDTDGDTYGDGEEVANGWDPLDALIPGFMENVPMPIWALLLMGGLFWAVTRNRYRVKQLTI